MSTFFSAAGFCPKQYKKTYLPAKAPPSLAAFPGAARNKAQLSTTKAMMRRSSAISWVPTKPLRLVSVSEMEAARTPSKTHSLLNAVYSLQYLLVVVVDGRQGVLNVANTNN